MAKRKYSKKGKKYTGGAIAVLVCIVVLTLFLIFNSAGDLSQGLSSIWQNTLHNSNSSSISKTAGELISDEAGAGKLIYYVINTGNSDSMVIKTPQGNSILIDAADTDDYEKISATLRALNIEKLDAVVATHPDADHIGSMAEVINTFLPDTIYMPAYTKTTAVFQRMIESIDNNGTNAVLVTAPLQFSLGTANFTAISPQNHEYDDANNSSIVLLMEYGANRLLLTGDAEMEAFAEMMQLYPQDMKADVLKVGHHGSHTSTNQEILDCVRPGLAIITCGADNDYGHPHSEVTEVLAQNGITVLRTDINGDIVVLMDGVSIEYKTEN